MDELEIQGKKYISSKRAAELTGYAKDYVGQLVRGGKLGATRIGRAWYVNEAEIRQIAGIQPVDGAQGGPVNPENRTPFVSSVSSPTIPLASLRQAVTKRPFETWSNVTYLKDDLPSLPPLVSKDSFVESQVIINKNIVSSPSSVEKITENRRPSQASYDGVAIRKTPPRKPRQAQKSTFPVHLAASALVGLILGLGIVAGAFTGSEWSFSDHANLASPENVGSDLVTYLSSFLGALFSQGVEVFRSFLNVLFESFSTFFAAGLNYLLNLF